MCDYKVIDLLQDKYLPMWDYYKEFYNITTADFITSCVISGLPVRDGLDYMFEKYQKERKILKV